MKPTPALFAFAMALVALCSPADAADCGAIGSSDNFRAHHDNYVLLNQMRNNGWAAKDERAFRVQYSFKYTVAGCPAMAQHRSQGFAPAAKPDESELFLAYTGQFDFYMGTRHSGPVINRISNPGIHWRLPAKTRWYDLAPNTAVVLSLEHRSDGQVFEPTTPRGAEAAQEAYNRQDRAFFDNISRGANFLGLHMEADQTVAGQRVDLSVTLRSYLSHDSAVTWGPLRNSGARITHYDRLWLRAGTDSGRFGYWEAAWRVGDRGLKTDSFDFGWQAPEKWGLPLYAQLHLGPMNTLSNYTQRQDSVGVGLRFTSF